MGNNGRIHHGGMLSSTDWRKLYVKKELESKYLTKFEERDWKALNNIEPGLDTPE